MAKSVKRGMKDAAIRKLLERNPQLKVREVIDRLDAKGISVSESQAYGIRNRLKEKTYYNDEAAEELELGELVCNSQHRPSNVAQVVLLASQLGINRMREILDVMEEVQASLAT